MPLGREFQSLTALGKKLKKIKTVVSVGLNK